MTPLLLERLCDPASGDRLTLTATRTGPDGAVVEGELASPRGARYAIRGGIPRFVDDGGAGDGSVRKSVTSFGDQWNYFNFDQFRRQWLHHTVANTFGTAEIFRGKVVVDAGAGSGAQAVWMLESGARHVILLELSHAVDGVILDNLRRSGYTNWDVVQCSIDAPPIRPRSIDLVMCHNVIQHTPSVEDTARALYDLVAPDGELVFNCYPKNDQGVVRWLRFHGVYSPLRAVLSRMPFRVNLAYATTLAALRLVPGIGVALEKAGFCTQGDVVTADGGPPDLGARFRATRLNTFDCFGSHAYQHHKTDDEMRALVASLQPDPRKIENAGPYFSRPAPIGCALRVRR